MNSFSSYGKTLTLLSTVLLFFSNIPMCESAQKREGGVKRVLVLYSFHEGLPWEMAFDRSLRETLESKSGFPIELNIEHMVLDYAVVKELVKPIIDKMDHRYLVSQDNMFANDPYAKIAQENGDAYVLSCDSSSAEQLAEYLEARVRDELLNHFECIELPFEVTITVEETPSTSATYWRDHV